MSATSNSAPGQTPRGRRTESAPRLARCWPVPRGTIAALVLTVAVFALSQPGSTRAAAESEVVARARLLAARAYTDTQTGYRASPTNSQAAWQFGRACFDLAELTTNNTARAEVAAQGIAACRQAIARDPAIAAAHCFLGMTLGQLADTKRNLSALKMVKEMEREFKAARDLDERFDFAGPDRSLGLLYREAPGWPASIGSRSKARQHLQRAVELAPDYPENRLNLLEACMKWGDGKGARRELEVLDTLWPTAHTNFTGEAWAMSWAGWDARLKNARKKMEEPVRPIESPRNKS